MERRELYDPEDIEQLLLERPFEELLEEERAFVMRHLSGREEYERMRQLLLAVHHTERDEEVLEAEPVVRERVLEVFRTQQRPKWTIWLNSVGGFLFPKEPRYYWRPALALASVALLVTVGLNLWDPANERTNTLAELKKEENAPAPTEEKDKPLPTPGTPAATAEASNGTDLNNTRFEPEQPQSTLFSEQEQQRTGSEGGYAAEAADEQAARSVAALDDFKAVPSAAADRSVQEDLATTEGDAARKDNEEVLLRDFRSADSTRPVAGEVSEREMLFNATVTNTSPGAVMKEVAVASKGRTAKIREKSIAQLREREQDLEPISADLMGLLRAAW